jgi:hypothetical protein
VKSKPQVKVEPTTFQGTTDHQTRAHMTSREPGWLDPHQQIPDHSGVSSQKNGKIWSQKNVVGLEIVCLYLGTGSIFHKNRYQVVHPARPVLSLSILLSFTPRVPSHFFHAFIFILQVIG